MSEPSKVIASVEEFKDALFYQSPIPIAWAVWKYKAQQELIEQQAAEIKRLEADKSSFMSNCLSAVAEVKEQAKEIERLTQERNDYRDVLNGYAFSRFAGAINVLNKYKGGIHP